MAKKGRKLLPSHLIVFDGIKAGKALGGESYLCVDQYNILYEI